MQHVQMRTVCQHITLHNLITSHHANMRGSSLRICVPKTFCHPRVMSRSLPHLTLTTSTSSLSRTSPILQSSSSTHPSLLSHDPYLHCDDSRRSCGSSDLQSPTLSSRIHGIRHHLLADWDQVMQEIMWNQGKGMRREPQSSSIPTHVLPGIIQPGHLYTMLELVFIKV